MKREPKTHCPAGHQYTEDNLDPYFKGKGLLACLTCKRARALAWYHQNKKLKTPVNLPSTNGV